MRELADVVKSGRLPALFLPKESFAYRDTPSLFKQLEEVSQRSGLSRGQAFEDFLHVAVCALGHPLMEDEYLETVERHKDGSRGKRGVDVLAQMFGNLVSIIDRTREDVLGDLFQGAISYGEKGQFLSPEPVCRMLCRMSIPAESTGIEGRRSVNDPCCGSGRMLLAAAELQPHWHFVGQDVDLRCTRMTAINLALRNHYGHVACANTLTLTTNQIYETGRVHVWGNAIRKVNCIPLSDRTPDSTQDDEEVDSGADDRFDGPSSQLQLF